MIKLLQLNYTNKVHMHVCAKFTSIFGVFFIIRFEPSFTDLKSSFWLMALRRFAEALNSSFIVEMNHVLVYYLSIKSKEFSSNFPQLAFNNHFHAFAASSLLSAMNRSVDPCKSSITADFIEPVNIEQTHFLWLILHRW